MKNKNHNAMDHYQNDNRQLSLIENHGGYTSTKPSALLNSIFLNTVNTAAKALASVASDARTQQSEKWKPADHVRFMLMMMTWLTVWILRVLMDHFPFMTGGYYSDPSSSSSLLPYGISIGGSLDFLSSSLLPSLSSSSSALTTSSSSSVLASSLALFTTSSGSLSSALDLSVLGERYESVSARALGRALTNVSL